MSLQKSSKGAVAIDGKAGGSLPSNSVSSQLLLDAYKTMVRLRVFEESCARSYREGKISGFCHLYTGQEAVATGFHFASKAGDQFITSYRCHAHALITGLSMEAVFGELFGRSVGASGGKGGSMHIFNPDGGFYGGHGIVGAQVPIGTGLAMANKYKGVKNVSFTFFGDGALNQGQVYESFNMAKVFELPVVFVIENNMYAMGTSVNRASANSANFHQRGAGFGIEGIKVDGMNFLQVYDAAVYAREYALEKGPIILELETYRYRGHSMSDPAKYRTKEEVEKVRSGRDPIENLAAYLSTHGVEESFFESSLKEAELEVEKSLEVVNASPEPDLRELYSDVY